MKPCVTAAPELWKGAVSDEVLGGGNAFPSRTPRRRGGGGRRQSAARRCSVAEIVNMAAVIQMERIWSYANPWLQ